MKKYADKTKKSGVESYEISPDSIKVKFKNSDEIYEYTYKSASEKHIVNMKKLAKEGMGLNTYISKFASDKFEK